MPTRIPILLAVLSAFGQVQEPPQVVFKSGVNEIFVDVVVRDKKGRVVGGLKSSDFTVLENGVSQPVTSFREVRSATPGQPARDAQAPQVSGVQDNKIRVTRQVRLVSLVYDRLGPEGRRLARQASQDFLKKDLGENVYYGVFSIDRGFKVMQPYTNNPALLQAAIQRATSGERSEFGSDQIALSRVAESSAASEGAAPVVAGGTVDGTQFSAAQAQRMAGEMAEYSAMLSRDDLGRMSVFSLWAIIKELRALPGRKNVLYFAEGLQLPNALWLQFQSMLSEANRAGVSVYSIDARGLQSGSDQTAANKMISTAGQRSIYARSTQQETAEGNRAEFRTFDLLMDGLKANVQNAMAELAESTGGFLIANTNDFRGGLQKLSEDFNAYYEVTYRPANPDYDGRFREITVKVNRSDVTVQARNGYFALPPMDGETVFPYEVPLLKALGKPPLPKDLEYRAGVLRYRQRDGIQQASLVFDLPMQQIAFAKDEKAGKYRTHISVLALVKDDKGHVVAKLSRDVPLNEPLDKLAGFQQGRFIVTKPLTLTPGRYTVESVAADHEGQRLAAKKTVLVVTPATPGVGISDLALIRRLDKPAEFPDAEDPLHLQSGRVIPTLVDNLKGGPNSQLSLFFTLYPEKDNSDASQLVLDLLQDGKLISRAKPAVPAPNLFGVIPYFANIPLASVPPGQYEFRATFLQGQKAAQRSLFVTIEESTQ